MLARILASCAVLILCDFANASGNEGTALANAAGNQRVMIRGMVTDRASGEGLRFATVRLAGSAIGTMTDKGGGFVLRIEADRYLQHTGRLIPDSITLVGSMLGYASDTVQVALADSVVLIELEERPLRSREVVVVAEDPAVNIMRRVLARKKVQSDTLKRYTYMLYTKFVAITDTTTAMRSSGLGDSTVFSILESYSKGYVVRPDSYFNEIIQRRQTANISAGSNFVAFGTNLNLYDDELQIVNQTIVTPFHQNALDIYDFELRSDETDDVVEIAVRPSGVGRKAFVGTIFIDQRRNMPLEVRVEPNTAVNLPFDAALKIRQTFVEASGVVMPEALSMQSTLQANILFILSPRLDLDLATYCYDYDFSGDFADDVFEQRRVEVTESAFVFDSTFWANNQKLPLRPEEQRAYEEIANLQENGDSVSSGFLNNYLGPIATAFARLAREPFSGFDDVFRYNRIHGPYLGVGLWFRPDTAVDLQLRAGYGVYDHRWYGYGKVTVFVDELQKWSVDASGYSHLARRDDENLVKANLITFTSALFGNDYGDYYYADGVEVGASYSWGQLRFTEADRYARPSMLRLFARSEYQHTAVAQPLWSVFGGMQSRRNNPPAKDGHYSSVGFELYLNYRPERRIARNGLIMRTEHSNSALLPTDATFTRSELITFARTSTLPLWTLDVAASVGWSWGDVTPQRYFSLESAVSGIAIGSAFRVMDVKEFYGDRYATLSLAHNFGEVIPGLLRIPNVASFGIEFITFGSVGWTQFRPSTLTSAEVVLPSTNVTRERVYYEIGLGINRILLFFRFDVTARMSQRDTPQWRFTLASATF